MNPAYLANVALQDVVERKFTGVDRNAARVAYRVLVKAVETVNGQIGEISPVAIKVDGIEVWLRGPEAVVDRLLATFIRDVGKLLNTAVVTEGEA